LPEIDHTRRDLCTDIPSQRANSASLEAEKCADKGILAPQDDSSSSNLLASFRSSVSNPSVNQRQSSRMLQRRLLMPSGGLRAHERFGVSRASGNDALVDLVLAKGGLILGYYFHVLTSQRLLQNVARAERTIEQNKMEIARLEGIIGQNKIKSEAEALGPMP
jgi:hypothetical protein